MKPVYAGLASILQPIQIFQPIAYLHHKIRVVEKVPAKYLYAFGIRERINNKGSIPRIDR